MNIKATFPAGVDAITVHGLTQWDYGRKLEIHSDDLPALLEVHFASQGMKDAIVRVGSAVSGGVEVTIPDVCLEQSAPIIAWVYVVEETSGQTVKTITLSVKARTRPETDGAVIPEVVADKYTEAVEAMNKAVEEVKSGDLKVKAADEADHAESAGTVSCYEVDSLDALNSIAAQHQMCGVTFRADVNVGSLTVPRYSKGLLTGKETSTGLIVTDARGIIYSLYRTGDAEWLSGRVCGTKTKNFYYDLPTGKISLDSVFTDDIDEVSHLKVTYCDEYGKKFTVELPVQRGYVGTATVIESVETSGPHFVQVELLADLTSISIHRWNWYGESSTLSPNDTTVTVQKIYGNLS